MPWWVRSGICFTAAIVGVLLSLACFFAAVTLPHIAFLGRVFIVVIGVLLARSGWDHGQEALDQKR